MEHPIDQSGGHGAGNGVVLRPVARPHHDGALGQAVLPDAPLVDEGVESLLYLRGAGVQLIQKEDVGLLPGDGPGRAELAEAVPDLGHADDVLRGQLAAQKGDALQPQTAGELLDNGRLADAWRAPDEYRPDEPHVQKDIQQLLVIDGNGEVHRMYLLLFVYGIPETKEGGVSNFASLRPPAWMVFRFPLPERGEALSPF